MINFRMRYSLPSENEIYTGCIHCLLKMKFIQVVCFYQNMSILNEYI